MPKTDVTEERGLSRLQGIDLREHTDQNVAHDCVNLRLDNASRLVPYPRPTKVRTGVFTFACESKDPSLQEFDFSLDGYFGKPTITNQVTEADGTKTKLSGTNLKLIDKVILVAEDGDCVESGQDFGYEVDSDGNLILDVYFSSYGNFAKIILVNSYGTYTTDVDIVDRTSVTLYLGGGNTKTFKMGVDNESLDFCIWQKVGANWQVVAAYGSPSANPWIEGAERKDKREYLCISGNESQKWVLAVRGASDQDRSLKLGFYEGDPSSNPSDLANAIFVQSWGGTYGFDPSWSGEYEEFLTEYRFGTFGTYRLYAPYGEHKIFLQMKSNSETDNYDITLTEWNYEE